MSSVRSEAGCGPTCLLAPGNTMQAVVRVCLEPPRQPASAGELGALLPRPLAPRRGVAPRQWLPYAEPAQRPSCRGA